MYYPVPGNVYDSDRSVTMGPTHPPFNMSSFPSTGSHPLWQDTTFHPLPLPGHLTPGAPFVDYHRPSTADPLGVYDAADDCDLNHSYQSCHQDRTTQRTWPTQPELLVGRPHPPMTPDFKLDSMMEEGIMPFPDFSSLPPVSVDFRNPWIESPDLSVGSFDSCDSLMPEFAALEHISWHVSNSFESGFDISSMLSSLYEAHSVSTHKCEWSVDGSPCNIYFSSRDNLKHSVSQHLSKVHNLLPAGGKSTQKCLWLGCSKELKQESIVRHILTVHLHITTACKACGTSFARQDSLQRHMRNSCGAVTKEEQERS